MKVIKEGICSKGKVNDGTPAISVVVPCYKVAETLPQALGSIYSQDFDDWEVVCIDDASPDSVSEIIDAYMKADSRFKKISHRINSGYGKSVNDGIEQASGKWIAILEPDDYLKNGFLSTVMEAAEIHSEAEIVKTPYFREIREEGMRRGGVPKALWQCSYKGRIEPQTMPFDMLDSGVAHLMAHHPSIWSAIYKKSFLEKYGIRLVTYPGAGWADNEFFYKTMLLARSIVYIDEPFYVYREETAKEYEALERNNMQMFFDRWKSMQKIIEDLGWKGSRIEQMHVARGFTYLAGLEAIYHSDACYEEAKHEMFSMMAPHFIKTCKNAFPALKNQALAQHDLKPDLMAKWSYGSFLLHEMVYAVMNNGSEYAWESAKRIFARDWSK